MMNFTKRILALLILVLVFGSCKKKVDDYYLPPANLANPVYQQLQSRGYFTKFLSLIDKAGYKEILSTAGYWTMFAPTDTAFSTDTDFQAFMQSRGISNVDAVDSATALSIVQYLLVFNGFEKDKLDDYQSNVGLVADAAFKRRTAYYTGFYNDTTGAGQPVKAIASNRNAAYVLADNNNKYIPFFTSAYFSANGLSANDYNYFYPGTPFAGFNVVNAKVTQQDIAAGNGVIHVIDHVITPLLSLDQYIRTKSDYSEFRKLLETYVGMVFFVPNAEATNRYKVLTGLNETIFVKLYSSLLAFSPNNENHLRLQENDAQKDGWTLMAPKNDVLLNYINTVLLENYPSVSYLPVNIIADLINSHMWRTALWPGKFNSTANFLGETPHVSLTANVIDRKILSNGFFYGLNKVNEPNVFSSVYGKAYLNPNYSIMTRLLDNELRGIITNINAKYTVFMIPDAVFRARGYDFNTSTNLFTLNGGGNEFNNLIRIINTHVVETPNGELDALFNPGFSGTGIISTFGGEAIRYSGKQIISAGTAQRKFTVIIDSAKNASNGKVYYLNNLLYFTTTEIGKHIDTLGRPLTSEFNLFWNYMRNSTAYDSAFSTIVGTLAGNFYTVFIPNNTAMRQAITDGLLPGTAATPNFNPTSAADKARVEKFIQYHVLDKKQIIPDKKDVGTFPTLLRLSNGDPATVSIQYPANVLEITDVSGRKAQLVTALSNNLSNRAVIHLINNYLKYP